MEKHSYPLAEAAYEDPTGSRFARSLPPEKKPKVLCVICTHFPVDWGGVRYNSRDSEHRYHSYRHNRLHCLRFVLACHTHYEPGIWYEIEIVNNGRLSPENLAEQLDVSPNLFTKRPNTFFSFGAYKHAFERWGSKYDYFVFQEMDWAPCHDGWLTQMIDMFESDLQIGMIGNLIERHNLDNCEPIPDFMRLANPGRNPQYNLDSEYFFTSREVLEAMPPNWNIFPCEPETALSPAANELAFQQPLLEMGLKLRCFNDGKHTMFYCLYNRAIADRWNFGLGNLAPFVPEQTRLFCPEMQEHFAWYDGPSSLAI